ncbi:MAG: DUF1972 domain-containing protein [Rubrivivax sp.]|nr:DUF1972 domain-containing protein [Rubrivivax sp.]
MTKTLRILGCRGVPAAHGGFESFAEMLSLHLVAQGWRVIVYCQLQGSGPPRESVWQGVERVEIAVRQDGAAGTMLFDWLCIAHAARHRDLCLTLGYNTAAFCARLRAAGVRNLINMDGIEWRRAKWGTAARAWFWLNERAGCWLGDHLIADHPEIARHLATRTDARRISTIPYAADAVLPDPMVDLSRWGLSPGRYFTLVARAEPENSILEIVQAYAARPRGMPLVVLGSYRPDDAYHARVQASAGPEVHFVGPVYDKPALQQLRAHALGYLHGHRVGGTNPSLVEALGAGNAVFAHDNVFNRWVAGPEAAYFSDVDTLDRALTTALASPAGLQSMRSASLRRHQEAFTVAAVMGQYTALLEHWAASPG